MFRALLPPVCPQCGANVPRAAARRCPSCRTPFLSPFAPSRPPAAEEDPRDDQD